MKAASPEALRASPGANLPADDPDPDAGVSWTRAAEERVRQLLIAQDRVEAQTIAQLIDWLRAIDHGGKYSYARELGSELDHISRKISAHLLNAGEIRP